MRVRVRWTRSGRGIGGGGVEVGCVCGCWPLLGRNKVARTPSKEEGTHDEHTYPRPTSPVHLPPALAALAFGAQVAADEVTAPVEVDPFVVVAMDAAETEIVDDVEVTNITSVTIVDGAEEVVTTVEYAPVFTDAPSRGGCLHPPSLRSLLSL